MTSFVLMRLALFLSLSFATCMGLEQHAAFDIASASSTYSAGNLDGSPAFNAQQALSGGSGYWCSSGSHATGQVVTWTGVLHSRRTALGVKVDWAYSPGELKVLISSDGSNFEEAKCWQTVSRAEVAYAESIMFDTPLIVKSVTISMRSPLAWGYFGINSVVLLAMPGPFMLVSGITSSAGEQCLVNSASTGVVLEPCLEAIADGDGREIMQFDSDGQVMSMSDGSCLTLADGDTIAGGALHMQECSLAPDASDGRTVFAATPSGQIKLPRMGNFCLTMLGDGVANVDVSLGSDVTATSSSAQHSAGSVVDGSAESYWASGFDPVSEVDMTLDFGAAKRIENVVIDWEHPPLAFELQVASGGVWSSIFATSSNNLNVTKYLGPSVKGAVLRIRMTKPHPAFGKSDGHALYAIKNIRVMATSARMVVQDCSEAEDNIDARDKFFMVAVPEFDPSVPLVAKESAALLSASSAHLGGLLAELYVAMPSLTACGFTGSLVAAHKNHSALTSRHLSASTVMRANDEDDVTAAVSCIASRLRIDMEGVEALISKSNSVFAHVGR